jgi:hypothetical protein
VETPFYVEKLPSGNDFNVTKGLAVCLCDQAMPVLPWDGLCD